MHWEALRDDCKYIELLCSLSRDNFNVFGGTRPIEFRYFVHIKLSDINFVIYCALQRYMDKS